MCHYPMLLYKGGAYVKGRGVPLLYHALYREGGYRFYSLHYCREGCVTIPLCSIKGAPTLKGGACHYSIILFIGRVAVDSTLYNICREGCVTIPFCSIEGVPTLKGGACHYSIMFFIGRCLWSPTLLDPFKGGCMSLFHSAL